MSLFVWGLNHKTAPLNVREKIAVQAQSNTETLLDLIEHTPVTEAMILSTCNRTEFYGLSDGEVAEPIVEWITNKHDLTSTELLTQSYQYHNENAMQHLMRVSCGLDSMMLGEPQIFGQVKDAYAGACLTGSVGTRLQDIIQHVFATSKRVRTETAIGKNPISIAYAAMKMIEQEFSDLASAKILLIGAGDTIQLSSKYLRQFGCKQFSVANRTKENAQFLLNQLDAEWVALDEIADYLPEVDIAITATACPLPFIRQNMIKKVMGQRNKLLYLVDLSVPRDIESEVGDIENVILHNVDDLENIINEHKHDREISAEKAGFIIEHEVERYQLKLRGMKAAKSIRSYRQEMDIVRQSELQRARELLQRGQSPDLILEEFSMRLTNKMMHRPSLQLRKAGFENQEEILRFAEYVFCGDKEV